MNSNPQDTRTDEVMQAHSALALQTLRAENAKIREGSPALESAAAEEALQYSIHINYIGALVTADVTIEIYDSNGKQAGRFEGRGMTLGAGFGDTWGTLWLNYPLDAIKNWSVLFLAKFEPLGSAISLSGLHGEYIGFGLAGGIGTGLFGLVAGPGKFTV